jgi:hypothetical protein|tara:strand:+ start:124 stop:330 length:207 start_codon:yes stop_codon:yes gene_type:complete
MPSPALFPRKISPLERRLVVTWFGLARYDARRMGAAVAPIAVRVLKDVRGRKMNVAGRRFDPGIFRIS